MQNPAPHRDAASLPGPRGWPLLGNVPELDLVHIHQVLEGWVREYGPLFRFRIGRRVLIGVSDPDAVREILHDRPRRFSRGARIAPIFEEMGLHGVFAAEGEAWKRQRRLWTRALNIHQIKPFLADLEGITAKLCTHWAAAARTGAAVDVQADLMRYTVDVTTRFALGHDSNTLGGGGDVIQQHLHRIFPMLNRRINAPFPYWRYLRLPADRGLERALAAVREFVGLRIAETRERLAAQPALREQPSNLIEALIVSRDEEGMLSDDEIYANTMVALLAGEDTTANTLAWMIHFLAREPQRQAQLRRELEAETPGAVGWSREDGTPLRHIDAIMHETLRLKPVAPIMGACALEDVELAGVRFAAGTEFVIPMRARALLEEEFTDAQRFSPERWLGAETAHAVQRPPHPFGGGPRLCPGRSLAQTEVRSVISMLARRLAVQPVGDSAAVDEHFDITMGPSGLRVRLVAHAPEAASMGGAPLQA